MPLLSQKEVWDYCGIQKRYTKILHSKLEWKVSDESDNSGVFVRFPDPDNNPNNAVREGYEIQIDDQAATLYIRLVQFMTLPLQTK